MHRKNDTKRRANPTANAQRSLDTRSKPSKNEESDDEITCTANDDGSNARVGGREVFMETSCYDNKDHAKLFVKKERKDTSQHGTQQIRPKLMEVTQFCRADDRYERIIKHMLSVRYDTRLKRAKKMYEFIRDRRRSFAPDPNEPWLPLVTTVPEGDGRMPPLQSDYPSPALSCKGKSEGCGDGRTKQTEAASSSAGSSSFSEKKLGADNLPFERVVSGDETYFLTGVIGGGSYGVVYQAISDSGYPIAALKVVFPLSTYGKILDSNSVSNTGSEFLIHAAACAHLEEAREEARKKHESSEAADLEWQTTCSSVPAVRFVGETKQTSPSTEGVSTQIMGMDRINGKSLFHRIRDGLTNHTYGNAETRKGSVDQLTTRVLLQVCRALSILQSKFNMMHRDLLPTNIIACGEAQDVTSTIIDFGMATARFGMDTLSSDPAGLDQYIQDYSASFDIMKLILSLHYSFSAYHVPIITKLMWIATTAIPKPTLEEIASDLAVKPWTPKAVMANIGKGFDEEKSRDWGKFDISSMIHKYVNKVDPDSIVTPDAIKKACEDHLIFVQIQAVLSQDG